MTEEERKELERKEWRERLEEYKWLAPSGEKVDVKQLMYDLLEYKDYIIGENYTSSDEKLRSDAISHCLFTPKIFKGPELYKNFILKLLDENSDYYIYIDDDLKNDKDITYKAIKSAPSLIKKAPEKFQTDKELGVELLEENEFNFAYISPQLKDDVDFLLEAIKRNPYVRERIPADKEEKLETYEKINQAKEEIKTDLKEIKSDLTNVAKNKKNSKR